MLPLRRGFRRIGAAGSVGVLFLASASAGLAQAVEDSPSVPAAPIESARPDERQIREAIELEGYDEVRNLRREGGRYLAEARRYGETVRVEVDATTRLILEPTQLSERQVANKLSAEGYSDIRGLGRGSGGIYTAEASKDGQTLELSIDPNSGEVMLERPR